LFVGAPWLAGSIFEKPGLQMPFMIGALAVVPFSLAMIQAEALRGIKNIVASQWIKTVLISLGCLILLYPFASEWGVEGAVAAYVLSAGLTFMIAAYLWRKSMSALAQDADGTGHSTREVLASSWLLYGVALSGLVIQQAATVLLGVWGSSADVGVFVVARRIASLLLFPLMSMISILAPKFSMMTREKDMDGLARLARQSSMLLIAFSLPAALFVYLGSEWILGWFGPEFVEGSAVLGILLIGVVVNAATGPVGNILMMCGYERLVRQVSLISAGILVLGCTVFIPMLGAIGAAGASSIAVAIMNLYMTIMVRRELGFWPVGVHRL